MEKWYLVNNADKYIDNTDDEWYIDNTELINQYLTTLNKLKNYNSQNNNSQNNNYKKYSSWDNFIKWESAWI